MNRLLNKMIRQKNVIESKCQVCGIDALYSYYGAIVCKPCKVFFRRNALKTTKQFQCHFDGHCQINENNRHICCSCRLKKCFQIGMNVHLFRSYSNKKFETINLLENDKSTLNNSQWNLISNISNCYNEYSGLNLCQTYLNQQNNLPIKIRYKSSSIIELLQQLMNSSQTLYEKNQDFIHLSTEDRSLLISNTCGYISSLSTTFLTRQVGLTDSSKYYDALDIISTEQTAQMTKYISQRIHSDIIVVKIFLSILSFSTTSLTIYSKNSITNLSNIRRIIQIQDQYIEILWKYLIYKYNYQQAIQSISDLLRCFFALHDGLILARDIQWYSDTVQNLAQQTEINLNLIE